MLDVPYRVLYRDSKPTTDICIGEVAIGVAGSSASTTLLFIGLNGVVSTATLLFIGLKGVEATPGDVDVTLQSRAMAKVSTMDAYNHSPWVHYCVGQVIVRGASSLQVEWLNAKCEWPDWPHLLLSSISSQWVETIRRQYKLSMAKLAMDICMQAMHTLN